MTMAYTVATLELEVELQRFLNKPRRPPSHEVAHLAGMFLRERGESTDMAHMLVAMKSLNKLYGTERRQGNDN